MEFLTSIIQFLKSLIIPGAIGSVCPGVSLDPPSTAVFLANLSHSQLILLSIGSLLTLILLGIAATQWYYVWWFVSMEKRQNMLYYLIMLLPFSACCSLVGMFIPRSAAMMTSIGIFYYFMCLFVLAALIRHLNDGRQNLVDYLKNQRRLINLQSAPFCCFMWFLPQLEPSEMYLRILEWMVLQAPIVRMLVVLSNVTAICEFRESARHWFHWSDMGTVASPMLAVFGIHTLARMTGEKLSKFRFMRIFRIVDMALFIFTAQQPLIFENIFVRFSIFECEPILSPVDSAKFVCNFVIICEMLILSMIATRFITPKHSELFDLFDKLAKEDASDEALSIASIMDR